MNEGPNSPARKSPGHQALLPIPLRGCKLSVPGKTFLVGEYLALRGGPSLILCTAPRFVLEMERVPNVTLDRHLPFAPASPAGRLASRLREESVDALASVQLKFVDPHFGAGGLGASTAQFALLWATVACLRGESPAGQPVDWGQLLEWYRSCAWNGEGAAPSGADLVAQLSGWLTEFDGRASIAHARPWPFTDLEFTLFRTGKKLATHEHLRGVNRSGAQDAGQTAHSGAQDAGQFLGGAQDAGSLAFIPEESLRPLVEEAKTALNCGNSLQLAKAVDAYGIELAQAGLVASTTAEILADLRAADRRWQFGLQAAKGCGAMGADVIALLHSRNADEVARLRGWLVEKGLVECGRTEDLTEGLRIE